MPNGGLEVIGNDIVELLRDDDEHKDENTKKACEIAFEGAKIDEEVEVTGTMETSASPLKIGDEPILVAITIEYSISKPDLELNVETFSKHKDYATETKRDEVKKSGAQKIFEKVQSSSRMLARQNKYSL